ncbi:NB-ARC domain-containing protein [Sulfitobacter sp. HNIBRBA2951]|uniref:NB-ARC domain-containing protein n=1 Tax=Sulfitobacter aquimarinus TaxID=3158557 RepID=UPI0032E0081A
MASLQKIALFIFFDSIESDLIWNIRKFLPAQHYQMFTSQEAIKATDNLSRRNSSHNLDDPFELLSALDLGEKYDILMRLKKWMDNSSYQHFSTMKKHFDKCISVRNTVMHGRPLTIDEYAVAFALTSELIKFPTYWPTLNQAYKQYSKDPNSIAETAIKYLDEFTTSETFNNLPYPDYDDTGFFPRRRLEADLKKKILGRHPVITVLGDGGDGKTAVTLQTVYGLLSSNDHDFDAIIWVSAKSSKLTGPEIERIETKITNSMAAFEGVSDIFEDGASDPMDKVLSLMKDNKILLVIDNLETIIDKRLRKFAEDVPGESKLVLTSRVPLGSDLTVHVEPFTESEALSFLRVLISSFNVRALRNETEARLIHFAARLHNKPLLLKWFALGVLSGLSPSNIVSDPKQALRFCLENVFDKLAPVTKRHLAALASLPSAASLAVLAHVTEDDVLLLEASVAELLRYAIVEQVQENGYETSFQVKPLAKSYLVRVLKMSANDSKESMKRFRQIDGLYQNERAANAHNKFNPSNYTIRSKSEALAVKKLKIAVSLAKDEDYLSAFSLIDELKVTNSDYFEVYRVEAYVASLSGDNPRAQDAYISATEIGIDQPQVHIMYGGFLLRTFNDPETALEQFEAAIILDKKASFAHIEASRASLYLSRFDIAQEHLDNAITVASNDIKTQNILSDLQVQIFWRKIDLLMKQSDEVEISGALANFASFLSGFSVSDIDILLVRRFKGYLRSINSFKNECKGSTLNGLLGLETQISELLFIAGIPQLNDRTPNAQTSKTRVGTLKQAGKKPTFGFIIDLEGTEVFVFKGDTKPEVWKAMLTGSKVRFDITGDGTDRTKAENVTLA